MFDWDKIVVEVDNNVVDLTAGEVALLIAADADTVTWGNITGDLSQQADLMLELDSKIDVDSPEFTGTPRTPTPPAGNSSTRIANTKFVKESIDAIIPPGGFGLLAAQDTVDYQHEVTNKPTLGALASKDKANYETDLINKPTLGTIAQKDEIDYSTDIVNKPTLGSLASKNSADYQTDITNKPNLGSLASKNKANYNTDITNKPNFGDLAFENSVDYDTQVYNKPDTFEYAPEFWQYYNYKIGDYVKYDDNLYRFIHDHNATAWDPMDVEETHYSRELSTGEKSFKLSDSEFYSLEGLIRGAGAHANTKISVDIAGSHNVKTLLISGHKRITVEASNDGTSIARFNGDYGAEKHLQNLFYSIIVEDGAILELKGTIKVHHPDSNGILIRRGGMVIHHGTLNIDLPAENYHDGIYIESGGKFISDGTITATRGSTVWQQYPSHVIYVDYGGESHVNSISASYYNYCIGCRGGLASYNSISGAGVTTSAGGRIFTGAQ